MIRIAGLGAGDPHRPDAGETRLFPGRGPRHHHCPSHHHRHLRPRRLRGRHLPHRQQDLPHRRAGLL